jgi:hypothetical protein
MCRGFINIFCPGCGVRKEKKNGDFAPGTAAGSHGSNVEQVYSK